MCTVIAILLHFFYLCTFSWLFLEGLHVYRMISEVRDINYGPMRFYYLIGWGVPAFITGPDLHKKLYLLYTFKSLAAAPNLMVMTVMPVMQIYYMILYDNEGKCVSPFIFNLHKAADLIWWHRSHSFVIQHTHCVSDLSHSENYSVNT